MPALSRRVLMFAAVLAASALVLRADVSVEDARLQLQLAGMLFDEGRYVEALAAYDVAARSSDQALVVRARKGKVRGALRLGEFSTALQDAERLRASQGADPEALTLHGDALWASALFDEAERAYADALDLAPSSSRARLGLARALGTRNRVDDALREALAAAATAPDDPEIHGIIGEFHERLRHYDEAVRAYRTFIGLLPASDTSDRGAWTRAQIRFLESFGSSIPLDIDAEDLQMAHTVPFRLVRDKVVVKARVNGRRAQDFVLDTGSEETVISGDTARRANVRPVTYTLSAGVGEVGLRGLLLARLESLEIGTLRVQNLPVLVKAPALQGLPTREGESFSPIPLGMSVQIDYERKLLTIARRLPPAPADFRLPMRVHRLPIVHGVLNASRPVAFIVDTGGEVISISADTAGALGESPFRRIPLKVYGTSGWDRDAFLLPGVDLDFDRINYRNYPLVVLNLRAPSVLLGFQVGGIVGHRFLAGYRVAMDIAAGELRLEKF